MGWGKNKAALKTVMFGARRDAALQVTVRVSALLATSWGAIIPARTVHSTRDRWKAPTRLHSIYRFQQRGPGRTGSGVLTPK